MHFNITHGDLLDQDVDVIVNPWNRNIIPWWLLLPQGVSGAIKKRGGTRPFNELRNHGTMPLGSAVLTSAGKLPFKGIIHVAGINMLWRASVRSIRNSVNSAMMLASAEEHSFQSIALPLIGAGSGGFKREKCRAIMEDQLGCWMLRSTRRWCYMEPEPVLWFFGCSQSPDATTNMNVTPTPMAADQKLASDVVILNAIETFHCQHLTDDQMRQLNPLLVLPAYGIEQGLVGFPKTRKTTQISCERFR